MAKNLEQFIIQYFDEIEKAVALAVDKIMKGEMKKMKAMIRELAKPGPKGDPGPKGKDADETEILMRVLSQTQPKIDKIAEEIRKEMPKELSAEELRDKLNTLSEAWLDADMIIGLVQKIKKYAQGGSGGGGDTTNFRDLSSELDGSTKTFTLTRVGTVLGVFATSFPGAGFQPLVDWTYDASLNQFTLGDNVLAPKKRQILWLLVKES